MMKSLEIGRQFGLVLGVALAGCGTPPPSAAPTPAGSTSAAGPTALAGHRLIDLYRRAGFVSSREREFGELWADSQEGPHYAWHGADGLVPVEPGTWAHECRAFDRAPEALRLPDDDGRLRAACRRLEPTFHAEDFERSVRRLLDERRRLRDCPGGLAATEDVTAAWDAPLDDLALQPVTGLPSALGWTAYASWADELGLTELADQALDAAEEELARACTQPPCTADELLRSAAQRAWVGQALAGLATQWLGREAALNLVRRADELGPDSPHPIAVQARALKQQLERDVERDSERSAAGHVTIQGLPPTKAVPVMLAQLPDTLGIEFEAPDRGCHSPNPAVQLVDIGLDAVPGLIALLQDRRLTRSVAPGKGRPIPLHTVGEVALATLGQIALHDFGDAKTAGDAAAAWWAKAQGKSGGDLAAEAFRSAKGPRRLLVARALGERDLHRLVVELPAAIRSTDTPHLRAALVRQLAAPSLVTLANGDRCAAYPPSANFPTPEMMLSPERIVWQRLERHSGKIVEFPPEVRRVVFRTLLLTLGDPDPTVRLAAAEALLSWGRKEGVARIIRDVGELASRDSRDAQAANRRLQSIEFLLATGSDAAIGAALPLIHADQAETLDAASHGLAMGLLRARATGRHFSIPQRHRATLADVAVDALMSQLSRDRMDYSVGGMHVSGGEWLLELLRGGPDYEPRAHATPFSRLERAYALVNAERQRRGEQLLAIPSAVPPNDPTGRSWFGTWRTRLDEPAALLESFRSLAQSNPGRQWRLRLVRRASGSVVHLASRPSVMPDTRLSVVCYGAPNCPWWLHGRLSAEGVKRRLSSVANTLSSLGQASPKATLDITVMLSVPAQQPTCPQPLRRLGRPQPWKRGRGTTLCARNVATTGPGHWIGSSWLPPGDESGRGR